MDSSIGYYEKNAKEYFDKTANIPMDDLYKEFEKYLFSGAKILDLGCGSGRDSKYFLTKGYEVISIDGSCEMCKLAEAYIGKTVYNIKFEDLNYNCEFDAVWASASLLHVKKNSILHIINNVIRTLKDEGVLYASWKNGIGERYEGDRYYNDLSMTEIRELLDSTLFEVIKIWVSQDNLERPNSWVNIIAKKVAKKYNTEKSPIS